MRTPCQTAHISPLSDAEPLLEKAIMRDRPRQLEPDPLADLERAASNPEIIYPSFSR